MFRQCDGLACYRRPCANARQGASRRRRNGPARTRAAQRPASVPAGNTWCAECDDVNAVEGFPRNRTARDGRGSYCKPGRSRIARANRQKCGSAICREATAEHDYLTSRVRGLPCFNCNGVLGQFVGRADLMMRAVLYLGREPGTPFVHPPSSGVEFYRSGVGPATG